MGNTKISKGIFNTVENICYKDLVVFISNFAYNAESCIDPDYKEEPDQYIVSSISLKFIRDNKLLVLRFSELEGLDWMTGMFEYELNMSIENSKEPISWYNEIMPYYHLEITGRDNMRSLFPESYIAKKGEVDETKIYDYVHKYLDAVKVILAEPDFQRLLYDPEFWIKESPYK